MQDFVIFDPKRGFHVKSHVYIQILRSIALNLGQNIKKLIFIQKFGFYETGFWLFPEVLEGLGSSGRLIGSISTDPGTY